ncbi:hypothetical protein EMILIAHAH_240 [Bacillus phage vB_BanH_Emiliahah]|nr:hypothetical protein EMILIAHAH_240 [Bacillus phage vB_BanH_Emiliahah]
MDALEELIKLQQKHAELIIEHDKQKQELKETKFHSNILLFCSVGLALMTLFILYNYM